MKHKVYITWEQVDTLVTILKHKVLDKLDAPTVAKLMSDDEVVLNPKNPRTSPAIKQAEKILK